MSDGKPSCSLIQVNNEKTLSNFHFSKMTRNHMGNATVTAKVELTDYI